MLPYSILPPYYQSDIGGCWKSGLSAAVRS